MTFLFVRFRSCFFCQWIFFCHRYSMRKQSNTKGRMSKQNRKFGIEKKVLFVVVEKKQNSFFFSLCDSYTIAHRPIQLRTYRHWLFFFFPQTDKEMNDPYFEYKWNRYITVLFRELHVRMYILEWKNNHTIVHTRVQLP